MRFLRRLSAALSGILLLQLSLLRSGTLCALQHAAGSADMTGPAAAMAGMMMGSGARAVHESVVIGLADASKSPHGGCGDHQSADSCGGPWAPGPCTTMSSCAWSQSSTVVPVLAASAETAGNLPEPRVLQTGLAIAPELPPPRA